MVKIIKSTILMFAFFLMQINSNAQIAYYQLLQNAGANEFVVTTNGFTFDTLNKAEFILLFGDNLGNHTATTTLNMAGFGIDSVGRIIANFGAIGTTGNLAIGIGSGNATGTKDHNISIGSLAGGSLTTGESNNFFGEKAGQNNTTGTQNVFNGTLAGAGNISGTSNLYIGSGAGFNNLSGDRNIAIGAFSGFSNTVSDRLFIGGSIFDPPIIYGDMADDSLLINAILSIRDVAIDTDDYLLSYDTITDNVTRILKSDVDTNLDSIGIVGLGFVAGSHTINTDNQTLSFVNPNISISGGNSIDISAIDTDTNLDSLGIVGLGFTAGAHDNLGNHTATQDLDMSSNEITNSGDITITTADPTLFLGSSSEFLKYDDSDNIEFGINSNVVSDIFRVGTSTAQIRVQQNSTSIIADDTPAFAFLQDTDTGMYRVNTNSVGLATAGVGHLIVDAAGEVGIGTSFPDQKLHVVGNARVTGAYYDSNNDPGTVGQVQTSTVTGTDWVDASTIGDNLGDHTATQNIELDGNWIGHSGASHGLSVISSGFVAIGSNFTPIRQLHARSSATRVARFESTGGAAHIEYDNSTMASPGRVFMSATGEDFSISTGFIERFRILENGNVGLGTTTPDKKLTVMGNFRLTSGFYDTNNDDGTPGQILSSTGFSTDWVNASTLGDNLGDHIATQNIQTNGFWLSGDGGAEGVFVLGTGFVGVGTNTPGRTFHVRSGSSSVSRFESTSGATHIGFDNSGMSAPDRVRMSSIGEEFNVQTGAIDRFRILENGNVGIGTTTPDKKLTVVGNFRLTSGFYDSNNDDGTPGQILSSTGFSTDWVNPSTLGDNLGDHIATENIKLNGEWLSNDGGNEGVFVATNGDVGINISLPSADLHTFGTVKMQNLGTTTADRIVGFVNSSDELVELTVGSNMTLSGNELNAITERSHGCMTSTTTQNIATATNAILNLTTVLGANPNINVSTGSDYLQPTASGIYEINVQFNCRGSISVSHNVDLEEAGLSENNIYEQWFETRGVGATDWQSYSFNWTRDVAALNQLKVRITNNSGGNLELNGFTFSIKKY